MENTKSAITRPGPPPVEMHGITMLSVAGYKSIRERQAINIKPLTVLAGGNSSGKSSMLQPLLLLKQTIEASYDSGPILLNGPNVRFTSVEQLFSKKGRTASVGRFTCAFGVDGDTTLSHTYAAGKAAGLDLVEMVATMPDEVVTLRADMTPDELAEALSELASQFARLVTELVRDRAEASGGSKSGPLEWAIRRRRAFFDLTLSYGERNNTTFPLDTPLFIPVIGRVELHVRRVIHVPGLRGNPERTYDRTNAAGPEFPGTFENYVAGIVASWQSAKDPRLDQLGTYLKALGLTWKVEATVVNDVTVELRVGRLPVSARGGAQDLVSIADVGFGVSQTLPVLVALFVAEPGQLVYIEQPEIHLHPRAQSAMAHILVEAAKRGVRVVIETHSALLVLGIQTLVAQGLSPDLVGFHWFTRDPDDGWTVVTSTGLDRAGAFDTDWPEDFADTTLTAESAYLDAAEAILQQSVTE